jgi:uncharacterized membrane protein
VSERTLRLAVGVLALAGAAIAAYLTYVRYGGATLTCTTGGCETVQSSPYAELLGVPVSALGLAGYLAIGATALAAGDRARVAGAALALAAAAFSAYLLVLQLTVIGAVCDWCLANDVVAALVAAAALLRLRRLEVAGGGSVVRRTGLTELR